MTANDRPLVTKKGHEPRNTAQSGGLVLMTGVGPQHTPATKIWFGKASNAPGFRSLPHHHGQAETGAYFFQAARASISARTTRTMSRCRRAISCSFRLSFPISKPTEHYGRALVAGLPHAGEHRGEPPRYRGLASRRLPPRLKQMPTSVGGKIRGASRLPMPSRGRRVL